MRQALITAWLLLSLLLSANIKAQDEEEGDVDFLELASLMLRDGNLERAKLALSQVDLDAEETDVQRYYVLTGLMEVRRTAHEAAKNAFLKAIELGPVDAVIHVYLAQSAFSLEDYALTIQALDNAGAAVERIPSVYHMRAQSHWLLKDYASGIAVLRQAQEIFPDEPGFTRRIIFYLIDIGLYKEAAQLGEEFLEKYKGTSEDYVGIGNALRASGEIDAALKFLQLAKLKFPHNENVNKSLAAVYINQEQYHSAAAIVHESALLNQELISEAAELYRRAGQPFMALSLNGLIENQSDKFKQRLALLIELGNFEQAAAMENDILRVRIDDDENIQYALAYALFKTGNYPSAEKYLARITDTQLFQKAVELRKVMEECSNEIWRCQ
ncbi:tetratricopeptide repeat protein [Marinicella sp. W31]|uniref:tetratricopeptide repeat protein n=1 Tax=Marinicella sp. W31 TaxID=3023713 RepID=UPI0037580A3B